MKGGCEIGRKNEPKGGCKVGKKLKLKIVKPAVKPAPKKLKFKVNKPAPKKLKFKVNKPAAKPAPKKIKITIKKNKTPELTAITGLSTRQANAMSPAELFGKLPKELGQMVLQPSRRGGGTQVGGIYTAKEMAKDIESMYEKAHPGRSIKTKIAITKMTRLAKDIMRDFERKMPKNKKYNSFRFSPSLAEEKRLEIKNHVKGMVRMTGEVRPGYGRFDNL